MWLLTDDFRNNTNDWPTDDTAFFQDGTYHLFQNQTNYNLVVICGVCGSWSDVAYEAMMQKISGTDDYGYGIIVRQSSIGDIWSYYGFVVAGDGTFLLVKRVNNTTTKLVDWTDHSAVRKGNSRNKIRIVARGSRLELFVNDALVGTAQDGALTSGKVGLYVQTDGLHVRTEYIRVWQP
jgi:hypothetical protein